MQYVFLHYLQLIIFLSLIIYFFLSLHCLHIQTLLLLGKYNVFKTIKIIFHKLALYLCKMCLILPNIIFPHSFHLLLSPFISNFLSLHCVHIQSILLTQKYNLYQRIKFIFHKFSLYLRNRSLVFF